MLPSWNPTFCKLWLKLPSTLEYITLTHVCLLSFVRKGTQSTNILSYEQKWDGFLKINHWSEFLSYENCSRDLFQKDSPLEVYTGSYNLLHCATYSFCSVNLICHFRKEWKLCFQVGKVDVFKAKLELWRWWVNIESFDMFHFWRDFERDRA